MVVGNEEMEELMHSPLSSSLMVRSERDRM